MKILFSVAAMLVVAIASSLGVFDSSADGVGLAMLPMAIFDRFQHPKKLERAFLNYLSEAKCKIEQGKTIASVAYYHQADVAAVGSFDFFKTDNGSQNTNVPNPNSFQNPQSEHSVIWAVRIAASVDVANPEAAYYAPGTGNDGIVQNSNMTIVNNGVVALDEYPFSEFLDGLTTRDQGLKLLDEPIVWAAQSSLPCQVRTKGAGAVYAANQKLRITYIGLGLIS